MTVAEPETLSELINTRRLELGLSLKALAESVGCSPGAVQGWGAGDDFPRASFIPPLAKALGCEAKTVAALVRQGRAARKPGFRRGV